MSNSCTTQWSDAVSNLSYMGKAMTGAAILGNLDIETMTGISVGAYDHEFKCLVHVREFGTPTCDEDLEKPEVTVMLNRIKDFCRSRIQELFRLAEMRDEQIQQQNYNEAAKNFREMSKPSELGTVAELATKYGKSKSEIRRLKAQNLLHTLEAF